jgi:pimeloyl-ACP methyl ester carboxylesterase
MPLASDPWFEPGMTPILIVKGFSALPYFSPFPTADCLEQYRPVSRVTPRCVPWRLSSMWSVEGYAKQIVVEVKRLQQHTKQPQVFVVGWSLGGVAALYAMKHLGLNDSVKALVAFGAPFSGAPFRWSALPLLFPWRSIWQLVHGSRLIARLHEGSLPPDNLIASIGGQADFLCPPRSCRLPGARNLVTDHGHEAFLYDTRLHRLIASLLAETQW